MRLKFLIFCGLVPIIVCSGILRQRYTSSERVLLSLHLRGTGPARSLLRPIEMVLAANNTRIAVIPMDQFEKNFEFRLDLKSPLNGNFLASSATTKLEVIKDHSFTITYTTPNGIRLTVETIYSCAVGFFGPTCDKTCLANKAHQRCDSYGNLRCDIGRRGPTCEQTVDPRECDCQNNGTCVSSLRVNHVRDLSTNASDDFICECLKGFKGVRCEILEIHEDMPTENGIWTNPCTKHRLCLNGAKCVANGSKPFCSCSSKFTGEYCEHPLVSNFEKFDPSTDVTSYVTQCLEVVFIITSLYIVCIKFKTAPNRLQVSKKQPSFAFPKKLLSKTMDPQLQADEKKTDTAENEIDDYQRYTEAPTRKNENSRNFEEHDYVNICKQTPSTPPTVSLPPTPIEM